MKLMSLEIRQLRKEDIDKIASEVTKPAGLYERYYEERVSGQRVVLVAWENNQFAGYLTIEWQSGYPYFRENNIPEIADLIVLPQHRRQRIATQLMDEAEKIISQRSKIAGIGVGLYASYGAAQRMYVLRGYVPDGRGIDYDNVYVKEEELVKADDSLTLHFTKELLADQRKTNKHNGSGKRA